MKRLMSLLAIGLISTNVGCTLCSNCDDYTYGAFGGVWQRSDLTYGRVGTAFSPEGFSNSAGGPVAPGELAAPEDSQSDAEALAPPMEVEPPLEFAPPSDPEEESSLET